MPIYDTRIAPFEGVCQTHIGLVAPTSGQTFFTFRRIQLPRTTLWRGCAFGNLLGIRLSSTTDTVLYTVAPLLRLIAVRLQRTACAYRYQMLRHSYAPTPWPSGILADEAGFKPTNEGVKVPCLNRLATRHQ